VVVLDTNVVLDLWLFRDSRTAMLRRSVETGQLVWNTSASLREELIHVLDRGFTKKNQTVCANKQQVLAIHEQLATARPQPATTALPGLRCRDTADQKFIDFALAHAPAWLLTRDKDLLALARRARPVNVEIATPERWLAAQPGMAMAMALASSAL
jgi:putative PIN family toxin of toxin-antitoxin system